MHFHEYFETESSWDRPTWDTEVQIPKEDGGGEPFEISFCIFLNPMSFSVPWVSYAGQSLRVGGVINECVQISTLPFREGCRKTNAVYFLQLSSSFA